jgi:WD40 repeat protein
LPKPKMLAATLLAIFLIVAGLILAYTLETGAPPESLEIMTGAYVWPVACRGCSWHRSFHAMATLEQPWTVSSVAWSSDGKYLAVGSAGEGIVRIYDTNDWRLLSDIWRWDTGGFQPLTRFEDQNATLILPRIWGKNAQIVAPNIDDSVSLEKWDINSNRIVQKYYAHFPDENEQSFGWRRAASIARAVAVSSDGRLIAAAVKGPPSGVFIYDASSARVLQKITCGPANVPEELAFSPDGHNIAVAGCYTKEVSVYDLMTGSVKYQTVVEPGSEVYNAISYNQDGNLIAVGSSSAEYGTVTIISSSDGAIVRTSPTENATITNVQWLTADLILASYDSYNSGGSVARLWDAHSMNLIGEVGGNQLNIVAINPSGGRLAVASGKKVIVGDLK